MILWSLPRLHMAFGATASAQGRRPLAPLCGRRAQPFPACHPIRLALQCRPTPARTRPTKDKFMVDRIRRSWLIVPAHDNARLEEAAQAGADVIVLDLQDMVHDTK